jgi:hypothetical protein
MKGFYMNTRIWDQDTIVTIAIGYGLDSQGADIFSPSRSKIFSSPHPD